MYGYNEYIPLTPEAILSRVKEEDIFKIVIQEDIVLDKGVMYVAPYRTDTHPDCYFDKYEGTIWFVDFANDGKKQLNCFQFIQRMYNVSFRESMEIINDKLELGLGDNLGKAKKIIHEHGYVEEKNVKKVFKERVITILPRHFGYKDKHFWSKYEISKQNLIEDGVIPVELYRSTSKAGKPFSIRPIDVCYAYTKFFNLKGELLENKVKLYRPYASKEGKWFTNCNQNNIGSLEHLPSKGEILVISKSYKDCRILRNQGLDSIWFQNEGMIPSNEILKELAGRFDSIIVWFDNDNAGVTNSRIVAQYINTISNSSKARSVIIAPSLLKYAIKDPSDLLEKRGKQQLLEFLVKHKILSQSGS